MPSRSRTTVSGCECGGCLSRSLGGSRKEGDSREAEAEDPAACCSLSLFEEARASTRRSRWGSTSSPREKPAMLLLLLLLLTRVLLWSFLNEERRQK